MKKRILVVDDEPSILEVIEIILKDSGYDVKTSQDGKVFNNLVEKNLPDLILLDVLLSGEDGRTIVKKLRKNPKTSKIPIVMISANPGAKTGAMDAMANDFIPKPFNVDYLLEIVEKNLKA